MSDRLIQHHIAVRRSPLHGYGVFAEKPINKGEIVEECYILPSQGTDKGLEKYYFEEDDKYSGIFLTGYGVLYNHSDQPNLLFDFNFDRKIATFQANQFIHRGEELLIFYGDEYKNYFPTPAISSAKKKRHSLNLPTSLLLRGLFVCVAVFAISHLIKWLFEG